MAWHASKWAEDELSPESKAKVREERRESKWRQSTEEGRHCWERTHTERVRIL